ncbi:GGDEF domain-containing protein [Duganella rhizosphaerae]|uniref:GGDEF domain-containing protein n=1 Tax=Duganella rhizosphaerae TaxID=2885763 RepID=UPI0030EAC5C9
MNRLTDAARRAYANLSHARQQWLVFSGALAVELAIFVVDYLTGSDIRLHTLYIFPVSVIALKCERRWLQGVAFAMSMVLQLVTYAQEKIPSIEYIVDASVAALSLLVAMTLAGMARINHQRAIDLATSDELTGIANRRAFIAALDAEIVRQRRSGRALSLAIIDLDGFKALNDTRGHGAGDDALRLLASILARSVRASDLPARFGGDEFAVLMPGMPAGECGHFCKQLTEEVAQRMVEAGFAITASIGFICFEAPPDSSLAAVAQADAAMYRVKEAGRRAHAR